MSKKKNLKAQKAPLKEDKFSYLLNPLVSKTLHIYANAINSALCISSASGARPFPSVVNFTSRVLNFKGFCWQRGYRNPLASVSYKKSYQKFLEALHLCVLMRKNGGEIYVLFDKDELRPSSTFLDPEISKQKKTNLMQSTGLQSTAKHHTSLRSLAPINTRAMHGGFAAPIEPLGIATSDLKSKPLVGSSSTEKDFSCFFKLLKNKKQYESVYSWSDEKWVGGTFSNFKEVSKNINLYKTLSRQFLEILKNQTSPRYFLIAKKFHGNLSSKLSEKNNFSFLNKRNALKPKQAWGVKEKSLKEKSLPDLIIIENGERYRNVIAEAETLKIPVIAFVESDILSNISIALPLNAHKHYFLAFLLHIIYKI